MQQLSALDVARRALRARICPTCSDRPPDSEQLGPAVARSCESRCTIFMHLPLLCEIASRVAGDTMAPYERAAREIICQTCDATPSGGDYCADRSSRKCPLSRYMGEVVETLEALQKRAR